jgi:hypothetical protein
MCDKWRGGWAVGMRSSINRKPRIDMASALLCRRASKRGSVDNEEWGCRAVKSCVLSRARGIPSWPDQTDA